MIVSSGAHAHTIRLEATIKEERGFEKIKTNEGTEFYMEPLGTTMQVQKLGRASNHIFQKKDCSAMRDQTSDYYQWEI